MCPDQPQTEDRNLRKHREEGVIAEWQHQPKREEECGHRAPGDGGSWGVGTLLGIYGADSILRATWDSPLQEELTRAYYRLCRDIDRVGNRRAKEP